jgi:hypothetical protein
MTLLFFTIDTLKVVQLLNSNETQNDFSNYVYLFIGWVFGLFGTYLLEVIKKHYKKKEIKNAIIAEITGIRSILLGNTFILTMKFGNYNKETIDLIDENINDFSDVEGFEKFKTLIGNLKQLSDEEIKQQATDYRNFQESDASHLKTIIHPYLDANMGFVSLTDLKFQKFLIRFLSNINQFNENIEQSRFYFEKTFDISMGEENHNINKKNLLISYKTISKQSVDIISLINKNIPK